MRCAWQAYINLLPHWMRQEVDRLGKDRLQELRLRVGQAPELVLQNSSKSIGGVISQQDVDFVINVASEYSPWASSTVGQGYITAAGGHRIGVCGISTVEDCRMRGISQATSLCLRVARDFAGISGSAVNLTDSVLIIGPPGSGKTTLLRDLIRSKSTYEQGSIAVVDEREELFPLYKGQACFMPGERTDIISGCPKSDGIEAVLRSMNPRWIAMDEITARKDCEALLHAGWCGVKLLATAHAGSLEDLSRRPIYRPLIENQLFTNVLILDRNKSWHMERIEQCFLKS